MNAARRSKAIQAIVLMLQDAANRLEQLWDEETEAHQALPDAIRVSDRGEAMEQAASMLDDAISELESASDTLDAIT